MKRIAACFAVSLAVVFGVAVSTSAAEDVHGHWQAIVDGALPSNALALGHDADGLAEFVCRDAAQPAAHLGRVVQGQDACLIPLDGGVLSATRYDVLVEAQAAPNDEATSAAPTIAPTQIAGVRHARAVGSRMRARSSVASTVASTVTSTVAEASAVQASAAQVAAHPDVGGVVPPRILFCPAEATAAPTAADRVSLGFDAQAGLPYVDKMVADGSVWRHLRGAHADRYVHLQPGQAEASCVLPSVRINAQEPTPPELPVAGAPGGAWLKAHNESLLLLIGALVNQDAAVMRDISAAEQRDVGGDLFRQMAFRTGIAAFYVRRGR